MKQKQKKLITMICIAAGTVTIASASIASYATSNGYDVGKNAAKKLLSNENYTADLNFSLSLDGEAVTTDRLTELYDRDGDVRLNRISQSTSSPDYEYYMGVYENKVWMQDGTYISLYKYKDGTEQASVYNNSYDWRVGAGANFDTYTRMDDNTKASTDKMVRFAELIGDTLVGDLKNNIVYIDGDDTSSTYEISLDAVQIPEFVNAGLSAIFSSMRINDADDPFMFLGDDPVVSSAYLKFTVDNEGRLLDGAASGTLEGYDTDNTLHSAVMDISLKMSDYGTTKPERLDISSLQCDVDYYDMTSEGAITHSYKVNSDGSVITDTDKYNEEYID